MLIKPEYVPQIRAVPRAFVIAGKRMIEVRQPHFSVAVFHHGFRYAFEIRRKQIVFGYAENTRKLLVLVCVFIQVFSDDFVIEYGHGGEHRQCKILLVLSVPRKI